MKISTEHQGSLYAIISGLMYGLVGYFGIKLMSDLSIANLQFWRFIVSGLFMCVFFFKHFKVSKKDTFPIINTFCFGGVLYSAAAGVYFIASQYIGTGPSMVIFFTYPAMVVLINWIIYKNKIAKIYYFAIFLVAVGMIQLIDLNEFRLDLLGLGLAILSAVFYAFYIVCSKNIKLSPVMSTVVVSFGCAFACLIYALWDQSFSIPTTQDEWLLILGFGIVTTALPMLLFLKALEKISSEKASILSVTEPIFVVIFGAILLNEVIDMPKAIGIVAILVGALMTLISKSQPRIRHQT